MYIMYNDETPTGKFQRGHTKGQIYSLVLFTNDVDYFYLPL